ncbi:MAG: hypothetical protein Q8P68_05800 [Candidatus Peregrinibacteria bacterium]|nr:hypothetical protein [Candidatus Peregrinibacteria bacterium]MDZ4244978.1 hypothetical protein [Candidatus Gracilibacteria bacterium]
MNKSGKFTVAALGALALIGIASQCGDDTQNFGLDSSNHDGPGTINRKAKAPNQLSLADQRRREYATDRLKTREQLKGLFTDPDELDALTGLEGGQLPCFGGGNMSPNSIYPVYDEFTSCLDGLAPEVREAVDALFWRRGDLDKNVRKLEAQDYAMETVMEVVMPGAFKSLQDDGWTIMDRITDAKTNAFQVDLSGVVPEDDLFQNIDIRFGTTYGSDDPLVRDPSDIYVQYTARITDYGIDRANRPDEFVADSPEELWRLIVEWLNATYRR